MSVQYIVWLGIAVIFVTGGLMFCQRKLNTAIFLKPEL